MFCRSLVLSLVLAATASAQDGLLASDDQQHHDRVRVPGDLWATNRWEVQRRITSTPDVEGDALLSPDGTMIAFTRASSGADVCVPTAGGEPRRPPITPDWRHAVDARCKRVVSRRIARACNLA